MNLRERFDTAIEDALRRLMPRIVEFLPVEQFAALVRSLVSLNGGLTLVPMPGFDGLARELKIKIEGIREIRGRGVSRMVWTRPVDIVIPEFGQRSNDEPYLRLGKHHVGGHDCVVLGSGPGTYENTGQLNLLLRYLVARRARRVALVTGYFPLSRSDKDEGGKEFALPPVFVDQWQAMTYGNLDRIIAVDLHASQAVMSARTGLITEISLMRRVLQVAVPLPRPRSAHWMSEPSHCSPASTIAFPQLEAERVSLKQNFLVSFQKLGRSS